MMEQKAKQVGFSKKETKGSIESEGVDQKKTDEKPKQREEPNSSSPKEPNSSKKQLGSRLKSQKEASFPTHGAFENHGEAQGDAHHSQKTLGSFQGRVQSPSSQLRASNSENQSLFGSFDHSKKKSGRSPLEFKIGQNAKLKGGKKKKKTQVKKFKTEEDTRPPNPWPNSSGKNILMSEAEDLTDWKRAENHKGSISRFSSHVDKARKGSLSSKNKEPKGKFPNVTVVLMGSKSQLAIKGSGTQRNYLLRLRKINKEVDSEAQLAAKPKRKKDPVLVERAEETIRTDCL